MNPILDLMEYIPDVEARVFENKIYLYGSNDIHGKAEYCSREYYTFFSSDFLNWDKRGLLLDTGTDEFRNVFGEGMLYAPDCIEKDGKYYLFFCMEDGVEGVAVSDSPAGPFTNPKILGGVERDGIDPAIFVDDDGTPYYFWGQFHLRGARMERSMEAIVQETKQEYILTEEVHGFHEGASLRKYNGVYYMLYTDISEGEATKISYAVADAPLGPYKKGGVIIDNKGCDPRTWNNHGSMQKIFGEWYIFYHRSSENGKFNRRVCVERIYFDSQGRIGTVEMSLEGQEKEVTADRNIEAGRYSKAGGGAYSFAENTDGRCICGVRGIKNGSWCQYKSLRFRNEEDFYATVENREKGGVIEIWLEEENGKLIGKLPVPPGKGMQKFRTKVCIESEGIYPLTFRFVGGEGNLFELWDFYFC